MSEILWTDETWNPTVGCSPVSAGCKNCYAERMAWRLAHIGTTKATYKSVVSAVDGRPRWTGKIQMILDDRLDQPLRWRKPRRIFVGSMSDLFHVDVHDSFRRKVFSIISGCPRHTFQVLTKRADSLTNMLIWQKLNRGGVLPNLWAGVSVENRKTLFRIKALKRAPAELRFLSIEPLLESLGTLDLSGIDWVIVGGESGPDARPMKADWVREVRDQCIAQGVLFTFKQWGPRNAGRALDGYRWGEMPSINYRRGDDKINPI